MNLTRDEKRILRCLSENGGGEISELADIENIGKGPALQAARLLEGKELVEIDEDLKLEFRLTSEGEEYAKEGLPERLLFNYLVDNGETEIREIEDFDNFQIAMGHLREKGWGKIEDGVLKPLDAPIGEDEEALEDLYNGGQIDQEIGKKLEDRGLVESDTEKIIEVSLTDKGGKKAEEIKREREEAKKLTGTMLESGGWRDIEFSPYDVEAEAPTEFRGRKHVLRQLADRVKEVLIGMGFKEMEGPHVDSEFFINDILFMPQDHPARTHWDAFYVENPSKLDELPSFKDRVKEVHESGTINGRGHTKEWSEDIAKRLSLRGHTTSLSMRYLSRDLNPPQRFFSVDKVYRNDTLDPTHLLEFFQIEGWVMDTDLSVRDLMGTFIEFYSHFGIEDLEFKPHYNPYTEPSFEIFGRHPETDELIEIGNSGMFRREVLDPLDIDRDVEVIAWGLALERLLMLIYGFEDIRDVHGTLCDIKLLRDVNELW